MAVRLMDNQNDMRLVAGLKTDDFEAIIHKYKDVENVQLKNPHTKQWEPAGIIDISKYFMVVQTKHYQTSIAWRDILTGHERVKKG